MREYRDKTGFALTEDYGPGGGGLVDQNGKVYQTGRLLAIKAMGYDLCTKWGHPERLVSNMVAQLAGDVASMAKPADDDQRAKYRAAWQAVADFQRIRRDIQTESVFFSPRFAVASFVDMVSTDTMGLIHLTRWTDCGTLEDKADRCGEFFAVANIPASPYYLFALEMSIAEQVARCEGYIQPADAVVRSIMSRGQDGHFIEVALPDLGREAALLLAYQATNDGREAIPF